MCSQTVGVSAIASITSGVKSCGCGLVNRTRRIPSTAPTSRSSSREQRRGRRSGHRDVAAVRVHVLAEQRDLDDAASRETLDLGEDVADRARPLGPADQRHDAERAGVVAARGDRDPGAERVVARRGERRRERLRVLPHVHLRAVRLRLLQEVEQMRERVGADHHVDPRCLPLDQALILLREAAAHDDLEIGMPVLDRLQVPQVPVELVVGVLPDRAGVQHDHARLVDVVGGQHAVGHQQPSDALGIVLVHLAPEGADQVSAVHGTEGIRTPDERAAGAHGAAARIRPRTTPEEAARGPQGLDTAADEKERTPPHTE